MFNPLEIVHLAAMARLLGLLILFVTSALPQNSAKNGSNLKQAIDADTKRISTLESGDDEVSPLPSSVHDGFSGRRLLVLGLCLQRCTKSTIRAVAAPLHSFSILRLSVLPIASSRRYRLMWTSPSTGSDYSEARLDYRDARQD